MLLPSRRYRWYDLARSREEDPNERLCRKVGSSTAGSGAALQMISLLKERADSGSTFNDINM